MTRGQTLRRLVLVAGLLVGLSGRFESLPPALAAEDSVDVPPKIEEPTTPKCRLNQGDEMKLQDI